MTVDVGALLTELALRADAIAAGNPPPSTAALETILAAADTSDATILAHLADAAAAWGDHEAASLLSALALAVAHTLKPTPTHKWVWRPAPLTPALGGRRKKGEWVLVP